MSVLDQAEPDELDEATLAAIDRAEEQVARGEVHGLEDVRRMFRDDAAQE